MTTIHVTTAQASCPVCNGEGRAHSRKQGPGLRNQPPVDYQLWTCADCGLLFTDPQPTGEVISAQYDLPDDHEHTRQGSRAGRLLRYGMRAMKLRSIGLGGKLLEIGCGQGDFLKAARSAGFGPIVGVEPEKSVARYSKALGFDVRDVFFDDSWPADDLYDTIVSIQVLEHVPDPVRFVENAARVLAPGGRLVLETPCFSHPRARKAGTDWRYICPPWHLNLFDEQSLAALFERAGLQMERTWQHRHKAYFTGVARRPESGQ